MPEDQGTRTPDLLDRPEARALKVEDLLSAMRSGRVRVPAFQRGLKWQRKDALDLLDSIYRGYPVGTLLLWETKAGPGAMTHGTVHISANARSDAWWVVDGQQRIASLTRVLLGPDPDSDEFALYFDLDEARLHPPPALSKRETDPSRWLPMTEVLDSERLIQWLLAHPLAPKERRDRAIQLGKRIREYDLPVYIVRTDSEDTLRDIFGRTNSKGKQLEQHEVFDALHGERSPHSPATIGQIVKQLEPLGFGRLEEKILYRLLRVLQGEDITDRSGHGPLRLSSHEAALAYQLTSDAAASAIQFLRRDVGIPHYDLLPYKQPLVTLGKFFSLHPEPLPRSRALLVRWLWRGALNGLHRGDTVSTRKALADIDPSDEEMSVQRMLRMVEQRPSALPRASDTFNFRHAASKLLTLALTELKPRNLETGIPVPLDSLFDRAEHGGESAMPTLVSSTSGSPPDLLHSAANRLAHPPRAGLRQLLLGVTDKAVLDSHAISLAALEALHQRDASRFLALRATDMEVHFAAFFERHARWHESDRPSLSSLGVAEGAA